MHSNSIDKTSFVTTRDSYTYTVMSPELTESTTTFQRHIIRVLEGLLLENVLTYINEILIFSKYYTEHLQDIEMVFKCLRDANLKFGSCQISMDFRRVELTWISSVINRFVTWPEKYWRVFTFPRPKTLKELRSFVQLVSYYRRLLRGYAKIAALLYLVGRKTQFEWTPACEITFNLETGSLYGPLPCFPETKRSLLHYYGFSDHALGFIIYQDRTVLCIPFSLTGRYLRDFQKRFPTHDKEALALIEAIKQNRQFLLHKYLQFTQTVEFWPIWRT